MSHRDDPWHMEKHEISSSCVVGAVSFMGRALKMEDTFKIIPNINGTDISLFAILDGHAGSFASQYGCEIIIPAISDKIASVLKYIKNKTTTVAPENDSNEGDSCIDLLEKYVTADNKINYESLIHDEIMDADKILNERLSKALLFCGTTLCLVLVDITNKLIFCANVGDSRAVLCDTKGVSIKLSDDHKPNNPAELKRIQDNGGYVSQKEGCWRVEGSLATSRTIGDYPLKSKKVLTAEPDFKVFKYKDFKFFPRFIIIASDGLWDVISNQSACDYVKEKLKEQHCGARSLVKKAYARRSEDNISVVVIRFIKPKKLKQKSSFDPYAGTYEWLR